MTDKKITQLTAATTAADTDLIPIVTDVTTIPVTKKITWANIVATLKTYFDSVATTLTNKTLTSPVISTISNTGTLTLPTSTDTLVGRNTTDTLTNKTLTSPVISTISNTGTVTLPTATDTLVARATTDTLTNKRVTRRVVTVTQAASPTINTNNGDIFQITGLAQAITSMTTNLSGSPVAGVDMILIQITDNGTARAITWGASFASTTVVLPTTTVASTMLRVLFQRNAAGTVWDCVGVA